MNMDDRETVATDKCRARHSGRPTAPVPPDLGPKPAEDPVNPWPGTCGTGKLEDTPAARAPSLKPYPVGQRVLYQPARPHLREVVGPNATSSEGGGRSLTALVPSPEF